ncbi:MAG: serine/threonine protein kinase [Cyanothece sp. SIO2G6]|nr:serine/threonine protein kinase [Cyanothece sp. SIO2G6]
MPSPSIFCSQGHENSSDNRFCRLCGELLAPPLSPASSSPPPDPYCGIVVGQRYRLQRQLGHGGFGRTYLAEDINRFNERCVLKEFAPQVSDPHTLKKAEQLFEREAGVLYQLQHAQIPCFRELLRAEMEGILPATIPAQMRLFLVQDYVKGQTYQDLLEQRQQTGQSFPEADMLQLLQDFLPVLAYIHDKDVIHRDISPDNLIQRESDRLPVLIDFGGVKQAAMTAVSGMAENQVENQAVVVVPMTIVGKQGYAPPEQMTSGRVSPHSDFYALGVTVLVLMTGQSPYHLLDPNSPGFWQTQLSLSPLLTRVLRKMLAPYPSDRYATATDILTTLFPNTQPPSVHGPATAPLTTPSPAPSTVQTIAVAPANRTPIATPTPMPAPVPPTPVPVPTPVTAATQAMRPPVPRTPSPPPPHLPRLSTPTQNPVRIPMPFLAIAVVLVLGGTSAWLGYSLLPQWFAELSQPADVSDDLADSGTDSGAELEPSVQFSAAEQKRKAELRQQRDRLGVSERFLVQLTDASFYQQYPGQRGRALTTEAKDEVWRQRWDGIAADWLDQLDKLFTPETRAKLGNYGQVDRNQWQTIVNSLNVSSRALYDLTDAQFFSVFSDRQGQDILNQPISQLWHGMAAEQLAKMQSGEILETIQFASGADRATVKQRLRPGSGYVYLLNAQADQRMQLNLNAPPTRLSLYVPRPTDAMPLLLEDSAQQSWSGELPQSGYYEIVVILDHPARNNQATDKPAIMQMTVAVDNVSPSETTGATGNDANPNAGP